MKLKILVVDDSKPIYMMVEKLINNLGHDAVWAEDGQVAINKFESESFDCVLLDWNMPVLDGLQFLIQNEKDKFCKCPIIMMTTVNDPEKIGQAISHGASEYIMKPFTEDILENKFQMIGLL